MYKIMYIKTVHTFELPDNEAKELKNKFPDEYKILEKNGKKFKDVISPKIVENPDSIYDKVVEKD